MDSTGGETTSRTSLVGARRALARNLATHPRALSTDGHAFRFVAPVDAALQIGDYVRIAAPDGRAYLGQITDKALAEHEGPELSVEGDAGLAAELGEFRVAQTAFRIRLHHVAGGGTLLARQTAEGIVPPAGGDVFDEADIAAATTAFVEQYLHDRARGRGALDIGTLRAGDGRGRAALMATGFDRHTFLCGQSGSGKTYGLGAILERLLLETDLRIVVIDPNSDFVHLGDARSFADAARGFGDGLDAAGYEALRSRYLAAVAGLRVLRPARHGTKPADSLRIRFSDLSPAVQGMVLQLDPLVDREEFNAFWSVVTRLGGHPYSLADVRAAAAADLSHEARRVALRIANLGVADWDVWAAPGEPGLSSLASGDWRALVLDVGGFATAAEQSLVALGTLNTLWNRREERAPMLVVIDEAHNVCPGEPGDPLQATAAERVVQIAGEGRKFGLYLLLSTQRPHKLHPNVLSQCDNLVLMRMNSAADLDHLAATFSFVPPALLAESSYFAQGATLLAGKIVPSPLLARFGGRISREGGGDVATDWARPRRQP